MKKILFLISIVINITAAYSQIADNWVFGYKYGLNFSSGNPVQFQSAINDRFCSSIPSSNDSIPAVGANSISDCNGDLLFYTNGKCVWNKFNALMPNFCLNDSNPGDEFKVTKILKSPLNDSLFYIFYSNNGAGIRFGLININSDSGRGNLISSHNFISNIFSYPPQIIKHSNDTDYWLVCKPNANQIYSYLISSAGVSLTPVISSAPGNLSHAFELKASLSGNYLLYFDRASAANLGSGYCCSFDKKTGTISSIKTIFNNNISFPNSNLGLVSAEFSPNDSLIYVCTAEGLGNIRRLTQFKRFFTNPANYPIELILLTTTSSGLWGMQLAPDGKIYLSNFLGSNISCITRPDEISTACNFVYNYINTSPSILSVGFPSVYFQLHRLKFISNAFTPLSCIDDSIYLTVQGDTNFIKYRWYIYDALDSLIDSTDIKNPTLWLNNGIYKIKLRAQNPQCYSYTWWVDKIYVNRTPRIQISIDSVNISCATHFVRIKYHAQYADSIKIDWKDGTLSNWLKADTVGFLSHSYYDSSYVYPILVSLKNSTCNAASSINDTVKIQARPRPKFFAANASKSFPIAGCTPLQLQLTDSSKNADSVWYNAISSTGVRVSFSSPSFTLTDTGYYKITQFVSNHDGCLDSSVVLNAAYVSPKPILSVAIDSSFPRCIQKNLRLKINHAFNDSLLVQWGDGFTNSFASLGNFRIDTITHAYANAGVYAVRIKIRNLYCDTQVTFSHLVRPALQHTTSNDTTLCKGALLSLWAFASGGDSVFTYILKDSTTTLSNASGLFLVSPPVTTVYRIGSINACALDTLWSSITVTVRKPINITLNTTDTVVCNGAPFVIKASAVGGTGVFTYLLKKNGITLQSNTSGSFVVNVTADETYTVLATDFCTPVNDSTTVHLKPFPVLQFTQSLPDLYFCASDTKVLHALTSAGAPARTYQWMDASGALLSSVDSLVLNPSTSFVLVLKISDACTTIIDTASVFVMPEPNDTLLSSDVQSGCAPLTVNFESANMVYSNNQAYEALWDFGDGNSLVQNFNSSSISLKAKHTYINPGVYTVRVHVKFKNASSYCFSFVTSIEALSVPQIALQITPAKITLPKTECTATITSAQADSIVIEWDDGFSDNFNTSLASFTQTHQYFDTGHYAVKAIAYHKNSCYTETRAKVFHADTFLCYIPNIFTPNRDNLNEVFKPVVSYCKKYELTIYNRWGELVFENTYIAGQSTITGWDGGNFPSETYLYQIIARDGDNNRHTFSGTVMLVR